MLRFETKQQNSEKQLSFNKKISKEIKKLKNINISQRETFLGFHQLIGVSLMCFSNFFNFFKFFLFAFSFFSKNFTLYWSKLTVL